MVEDCAVLDRDGFVVLRGVYARDEVARIGDELELALAGAGDSALDSRGQVYAARNVLSVYPAVRDCWRRAPLVALLSTTLGEGFGLVRVLFFDKPPQRTWSLPWHQDRTIAVREHRPSEVFRKPTRKAGVAHVEAPPEVLDAMLTLRIHLDAATTENGALLVLPGSHCGGPTSPSGASAAQTIIAEPGDVLAMRPLVAHASGVSHPNTTLHRRILHLEFAATSELADGFEWRDFVPGRG
jgi:ectoine hydroxylase-related dioxygenase (phytanoyl-CoA dioxygenase family)